MPATSNNKPSLIKKAFGIWQTQGLRIMLARFIYYLAVRHGNIYACLTGQLPLSELIREQGHKLYGRAGILGVLKKTFVFIGFLGVYLVARLFRLKPVQDFHPELRPEYFANWYKHHKKPASVVIPTYKNIDLVVTCLKSLYAQPTGEDLQIIVVDDGSPEEIQQGLKNLQSQFPDVVFVLKKENEGFAKTCNAGMKLAKSDVILLNNDTEVEEGWLEALQYAAYHTKNMGIVGPKLLYPNGLIQFAGGFRNFNAPEWFDHSYRMKPSGYGPANVARDVLFITGACMYIRKTVIKKIGLLDPKYQMAFEDVDYCLAAKKAGFRVRYIPEATVIHAESVSRGRVQGKRELDSAAYFWKKWGSWFDDRNVRDKNGKIRVIYVLQDTGIAGGHRNIFEHLNRLHQFGGFSIELYTLAESPKWFPLEVPVHTFSTYPELVEELSKQEAIKVATWWETGEPVWQSSMEKGLPAFLVSDIESSYYKNDKRMQNVVLAYYRPEFYYMTICEWNQDQLHDLSLHSRIIACGLDTDSFRRKKDVKQLSDVLLAIGRSHYLKNLAMTLRGVPKMTRKIQFWLFGIEPAIKDKNRGIVTRYIYKPSDEQVVDLYNEATVLVQTSRHEGFCLPIIEAMACGCAVVCTDADGNRDFCVHEKNCLMVPQDDDQALAKALDRVFNDTALRNKLVAEGYKTADSYSWPVITAQLAEFFTDIANKRSLTGGLLTESEGLATKPSADAALLATPSKKP